MMPDFRCDHVPPCDGLPGHQERQRGDLRKARAARAAMLRNQRGRTRAMQVLPGMMRRRGP